MGLSRRVIAAVILTLSVVVPVMLCAAIAMLPIRSAVELAVIAGAAGILMTTLVLVNWWEFVGGWLRWIWIAALVGLVVLRILGSHDLPFASPPDAAAIVAAVTGVVGLVILVRVLSARRPGPDVVELTLPVHAGWFLVTDGGDGARSFLVNYHYGFGTHRAAGVGRSMRYAMDVVEVGVFGASCRGFLPRRNDAFKIWERPLYAPCDGRVVHAVNDVADNEAFGSSRPYGVGNHVVLRHGADAYVVLGHLRQGSVTVAEGQDVRAGDPIGRVGNSGWTERPHLHMQAMRSPAGDWWHGEPLAMRLDGRFLVRNQRFRV